MKTVEVKEKIFYHTSVTTEGQTFFDENSKITIDPTKNNPRYNDLIKFTPTANADIRKLGWLKYLDHLLENSNNYTPDNWKELLKKITDNSYLINNRYYEKIFEEIRKSEYGKLPSRYSCIYLADKDNIELWHTKALEQYGKTELPIYEFKGTGQIHYADPEWLEVDIVSDDEYRSAARNYWDGNPCPTAKHSLREILFCGTLSRVKKYYNLNEFKTRL